MCPMSVKVTIEVQNSGGDGKLFALKTVSHIYGFDDLPLAYVQFGQALHEILAEAGLGGAGTLIETLKAELACECVHKEQAEALIQAIDKISGGVFVPTEEQLSKFRKKGVLGTMLKGEA